MISTFVFFGEQLTVRTDVMALILCSSTMKSHVSALKEFSKNIYFPLRLIGRPLLILLAKIKVLPTCSIGSWQGQYILLSILGLG